MLILKTAKRALIGLGVLFLGLAIFVLIRAATWKPPVYESGLCESCDAKIPDITSADFDAPTASE